MRRAAEPTAAMLARWRRLVREAAKIGASGSGVADLASAADAASKSVIPRGVLARDNPFVRLVRLAQRYVGEPTTGRPALARDLSELADECRRLMRGPEPEAAPGRPARSRLPYVEG